MSSLTGADRGVDTLDVFGATASLPEQVAAAVDATRGLPGLPEREDVEHVVVLGMGGSGLAGDIVLAAAGPFMPLPVVVVKSYELPAFVGESTLVFAISFSGDTEETIEAATEAAVQGARLVVVSGGGELARRARSWEVPLVGVPGDLRLPRTALGAMAVPPLIVLEDVGLFPGATTWIEAAVQQLRARRDTLISDGNVASRLARRIGRTIPVVHSSGSVGGAAGRRWVNQINENAKTLGFSSVQPELCHNEVVGWGQHGDLTRQVLTLVGLRHDFEHPQVMRRFDLVFQMLDEVVSGIEQVQAEGDGQLAQLLDLVLIGDFVSLYLAYQEGIDPGPTPVLDEIKQALAAE